MNEQELNAVFQHVRDQKPDPEARARAISVAKEAFAKSQEESETTTNPDVSKNNSSGRQGIFHWLRLITNNSPGDKENTMNTITVENNINKNNKLRPSWLMPSLGGVSLVVLAGVVALRVPNNFNVDNELAIPDSVVEYRVDAQKSGPANFVSESDSVKEEEIFVTARVRGEPLEEAAITVDAISSSQKDRSDKPKALAKRKSEATSIASSLAAKPAGPAVSYIAPPPQELQQLGRVQSDQVILPREESRDRFPNAEINPVKLTAEAPVSTFSIDVDTASYSFARSQLNRGYLPDQDAVRIEEFVNYFDYSYPVPEDKDQPFATHVMVGDSPWKEGNKLIHIGIQGYEIEEQPKSNLVFLLDVSGSMSAANKLPLVKQSIALLLDQLRPDDNIALVVYAGSAGAVLEPTPAKEKQKILDALNRLQAGGSTAGAQGIDLAYKLAEQNFDKDAVNRIVLATDGDFNVGISDPEKLKAYVEKKRQSGVFLSVLGFGQGNYHDALMQELAQNGNGVAAYIDTLGEAQKLLVNEASSALFTIAKDVKIQMEFNPETVAEYRLIGYETRALKREDFNNDKVDAGDIGAGHSVTALYEITPVGSGSRLIDDSRYRAQNKKSEMTNRSEYGNLKLRYKLPNELKSKLISQPVASQNTDMNAWQKQTFDFSNSVAGFSQLLKNDKYLGDWSYDDVISLGLSARGEDLYGYRNEFVQLVRKAKIAKQM